MLQKKAEDFAKELGLDGFKASNGWLESFKMRNGIVFRKLCGESGSVPISVIDDWLKKIPSLLQGYDPADIFNADETGLFFQCLPNKTAIFKGDECKGGKQSKVRVTILLAANQNGTEKLLPLMIGRSAKPRCFSKVKSFPLVYKSNRKSWMTSEIFSEWLKKVDKSMALKKRKILLFIDNCGSHKNLPTTKNVTVKFLPPNTTSKLQPLDQGIIRSFKAEYRKALVQKLISAIEDGEKLPSITVLDAMRMVDYAWSCVTEKTIKNCFKKAGFEQSCTVGEQHLKETEEQPAEETDEYPKEWMTIREKLNIDTSFKDFIEVDESVVTSGTLLTDSEILENVRETSDDEEDDDKEDIIDIERVVTPKEAEKAIETLRIFLESQENIDQDCFSTVSKLQKIVQSKKVLHQKLLTDYFL